MENLDRMLPGIALVNASGLAPRIRISSGTAPARFLDPNAACKPEAVVPVGPWRAPNALDLKLLSAGNNHSGASDFVAVISLPRELTAPLLAVAATFGTSTPRPTIDGSLLGVGLNGLVKHLQETLHTADEPARALGVGVNPMGRPTVTVDPSDGLRIGLHFDSWFGGPIEARPKAPNRVCVNFGIESRRLLFVNLPVLIICEILRRSGGVDTNANPTDIGRVFMHRFPDYPVVSVMIRPGEAYIAPTENIIHDGDTSELQGTDVNFTVLGRFRQPSMQLA